MGFVVPGRGSCGSAQLALCSDGDTEDGEAPRGRGGCGSDGRAHLPGAWVRLACPLRHPPGSPRSGWAAPGVSGGGGGRPPAPSSAAPTWLRDYRRAASWSALGSNCQQAEGPAGTLSTLLTCQRLRSRAAWGRGSSRRGGDLRIYARPLGASRSDSAGSCATGPPDPNSDQASFFPGGSLSPPGPRPPPPGWP